MSNKRSNRRLRRSTPPRSNVIMREVENPYFQPEHPESSNNPKRIMAAINTQESAVETLFARGLIDRAQKRAADKFRALWETMGGKVPSLDYTMDRVDGGGSDVIGTRLTAAQELDQCRLMLGRRGYDLICRICGEGRALGELFSTNREKTTAADVLRAGLDDLAEMWGMYRRKNERSAVIRSQRA